MSGPKIFNETDHLQGSEIIVDDGLWQLSPVRFTGTYDDEHLMGREPQNSKSSLKAARVFDGSPDRDGY